MQIEIKTAALKDGIKQNENQLKTAYKSRRNKHS